VSISKARKITYIVLGTTSLALAYIGVAMPGIPGIPFILLTAFFYFRSSDRLSQWLMRRRVFARVITEYQQNKILPMRLKLFVIINLWISIGMSHWLLLEQLIWHIAVFLCGCMASVLILRIKQVNL